MAVDAPKAVEAAASDTVRAPDVVTEARHQGATTTTIKAGPGQTVVVEDEKYCGIVSILIGVCFFPLGALICFCPVDSRSKVTKHG